MTIIDNYGLEPLPEPFRLHLPRPSPWVLAGRGTETTAAVTRALAVVSFTRRSPGSGGRALRTLFQQLGGTYLKLGQIVASAPGMFGEELSAELRSCLDTGPVVSFDRVRTTVENELGAELDSRFRSFEPEPIGRASLAVVHRAVTKEGADVAVKVLRPGIEQLIATDLGLMGPLMRTIADRVGMETASAIDAVLDGLLEQLQEELDLRNERRTLDYHRELYAAEGFTQLAVPESYPELSTRRVLTMEFLDGVPFDDLAGIAALGVEATPITETLVRAWFLGTLRDGVFHADIHAGNLLVLRDGRLGLLDWGIVGRLDPDTHRFLRSAFGAMLGNEAAWVDLAQELRGIYGEALAATMGETDEQLIAAIRGMFEPFFTEKFSLFTMAELMQQMPQAEGFGPGRERRSPKELMERYRENRRVRKLTADQASAGTPFNRGIMMLVKQLLYFERYGRLFLQDAALLEDKEFYRSLLAADPS